MNNYVTWSPPSRAEKLILEEDYQQHPTVWFTIIVVVAGEPPDAVREFIDDYEATHIF